MRRSYIYILLTISFLIVLFGSLIGQKKWIEHKQRVQQRVFFENMYANSDCIKNVILKNGMYIDPITFYNTLVSQRIKKCQIEEIALSDVQNYQSLRLSSRMKFLNGDKEDYKRHVKNKNSKYFHHTERSFNELIKSVNDRGYNYKISPIIVTNDNIIIDGLHRLCILMKKYDKNYKIKVLKLDAKGYTI